MTTHTTGAPDAWLQLANAPYNDHAYWQAWLQCCRQGLPALAELAIVLSDVPDEGPYAPALLWPKADSVSPLLASLCERVLDMRLPLQQVQDGVLVLALPIVAGEQLHGVLAVSMPAAAYTRESLAWLKWGQGWLLPAAAGVTADNAAFTERLLKSLDLLMLVVGENTAHDASHAVVTDMAVALGCDRVSVGFAQRMTVKLQALSHSAEFAGRQDLAAFLARAMNEAADQGQAFYFQPGEAGPAGGLRIDREHRALAERFAANHILSVPFYLDKQRYGVFVFEWAEPLLPDEASHLAHMLSPIVGRMLLDKRHAERPWWRRAADALKTERDRLLGPLHAGRKLAAIVLLALGLFLGLATGDYRVGAQSELEGAVKRTIVAPFDGFVAQAYKRAGQVVPAGGLLAQLDDRDLQLEASKWRSTQSQYQNQLQDAQAQSDLSQIQISIAQSEQAQAQQALSQSMLERSRIRAPFAGFIVTGDLSQQLGGAVKKGQTLFEIAPLDSYRVILYVEEADIDEIRVGQQGQLMVTAMPGERQPFSVSLVTSVAQARDGKNVFRVEGVLATRNPTLRPGMDGVAKVHVGERKLVWIWTHSLFDWLRLNIWSWLGW
ncbi:efflux RND transporter periplasmic adaptor subunit [Vogesella mureinivorans]|uniref:efflux RND transporter periplasmic adaptor subunit n=2 Tax=Vogesella TaxID=57739 RepID=UPI0011CB96F1|nr:HlyD family efflux transporter periplasmic adaptor subunit [Vogesella mureinivorans]